MNLKRILFGKRLIVLIGVLLTMAAAPVGILTFNQYMDAEATVSDGMAHDAQVYADIWEIDLDEAVRRLQLQTTIGEFGGVLKRNEADTYAGHWVKHGSEADEFGVVVKFTGDGEQTIGEYSQYVENGPLANMVEVRTAEVTMQALKDKSSDTLAVLNDLDTSFEMGINVKENRVDVFVADLNRLQTRMGTANVQLPSKVELVEVAELSKPAVDIYGGLNISCTSGFSVEHSDGTLGITTAGHCENDLEYNGNDLDYVDGEFNESVDLQWHEAPGFTIRNLAYWGHTYPRYIYGTVLVHDQSVEDFVCKYGRANGYHCGNITHVDFTPTYGGSNPACHPNSDCDWTNTFVRVEKSNTDICATGDSGGPVMLGSDAYGTIAFCDIDAMIYMPVDYFDELPLTVLTDS